MLIFVVWASVDLCAQSYNVYIKYTDGSPAKNVFVYSFMSKRLAETSMEAYKTTYQINDDKAMGTAETSSDGTCILHADRDAYLVVEDYMTLKEPLLFKLSDCLDENSEIHITIKKTKGDGVSSEGSDGVKETNLQQAEARGITPPPPPAPPIPVSYGRSKLIGGLFTIDGDLARDDARMVVFPRVVFPELDSVLYLKPAVVDGSSYKKSMERRMGIAADNDKLDFYHLDRSFEMQPHTDDRFAFYQYVDVDKGVAYYADAQVWYEDHNGIYHKYVQKLQDGKEAKPMRFLDWEAAKRTIKIDTAQYKKRGMIVKANDSQNFRLKFEVGKESLNLSDSTTLVERDKLLSMFRGYAANTEVEVLGITVKGYSSPEGVYARNTVLSQGRTNNIVNLIKREFPRFSRDVKAEFDEHKNVVTWGVVAEVMEKDPAQESQRYAQIIKEVVAQKNGFDAQQAELRKDKDLWNYVKDNVLPSVRRVEVSVELQVSKVLSLQEIVEGYQNGTLFCPGKKVMPYQYYELMRWLADNEKWDELYKISKMAYEDPGMLEKAKSRRVLKAIFNPKDIQLNPDSVNLYTNSRPGYAYLQVETTEATQAYAVSQESSEESIVEYRLNGRSISPKSAHKAGKYLFEISVGGAVTLFQQEIELSASNPMVLKLDVESDETGEYPYPLAAYYYATCLLQRGEVNTEILPQYLDDGPVNRKVDRVTVYNDKAMIASQILMHCQDGDFEPANRLIVKYDLSDKDPELKPLIMFVRCLAGDFGKPEIQDYIKSTSPMNEVVILAALENWKEALKKLTALPTDDPRVQYLTAICKFKNQNNSLIQLDQPPYQGSMISTIGDPMLRAFELDNSNVEFIQNDGYFNDAYRLLVLYFWKRMNEGLTRQEVIAEYDELVRKVNEQSAK